MDSETSRPVVVHRAARGTVRAPAVRAAAMLVTTAALVVLASVGIAPWWPVAVGAVAVGASTLEWWFRRTTTLVIDGANRTVTVSHPYAVRSLPMAHCSVRARRLGAGEWLWWFDTGDGRRAWLPTWDGHDAVAASLREVGVHVSGR